ncbi:MAG: hypothetical protein HUJ94_08175 [Bacteroidales bacterium]|nr:hypothetical protein [Bacteroidales bacterium]
MDAALLSDMLRELVLDHDVVTLPGVGSFVSELVPASFSDRGYTINPPYRRLSFRTRSEENTLLTDLYASANGLSREDAAKVIGECVSGLKATLLSRKVLALPGLGKLRATKENNIFFVAEESLDLYPAGFALEAISLKNHQETREEVSAAVESLKQQIAKPAPAPEPAPEPAPMPEPAPAPAPSPLTAETLELDPTPEPVPVVEDNPAPAPVAVAGEEPVPVVEVKTASVPVVKEEPVREGNRAPWGILIAVAAVLALLALLWAFLRFFPEAGDYLLYGREDRNLIEWFRHQ